MSDSVINSFARLHDLADTVHVRVFRLERVTLNAGRWDTQNVQDTFWRFYRNEHDGAFILLPDGERFAFPARRCCFVPAGVRFSCGNNSRFGHFYIHFDLLGLPSLTRRALLLDRPVCLPPDTDFENRVAQFANSLTGGMTFQETLERQCRAKALLYDGLADCLAMISPTQREAALRQAAALEPVAPAIRWIEEHCGEPLDNAKLAAHCCLSIDHFARRFKACVGQTPGAYLRERRITRAAQLLLFTGDSIESIAAQTGFGSRFYLTRVFTRAFGSSPAAYRKAARV